MVYSPQLRLQHTLKAAPLTSEGVLPKTSGVAVQISVIFCCNGPRKEAAMPSCPECENELDIEEEELEEGDVVACEECGSEYEVVGVEPLELTKVDEDYDEEDEEYKEEEEEEE
jgi:alpha-aminoadipate carrier protein LysW